jgi:uncharacterized protein with HEPN domain
MRAEAKKLLDDILSAAADIQEFTRGFDLAAYRQDARTRAAVERKFEIVGEACARLRDRCPDVFENIASGPQIIGFRNRLIHGYDGVDDGIVWDVIHQKLPGLIAEIGVL